MEVSIEAGAGERAFLPDSAYEKAGATIVTDRASLWRDTQVIAKIAPPTDAEIDLLHPGQVLVCEMSPLTRLDAVADVARAGATLLSLDMIPRITRAQSMDTLSSMATLVGYKAVLLAAMAAPRLFPMMTTAAGTITPAKVFIIGCGVAGLQAIATARRLGAVVQAFDTRPAVKEQVQSLGGRFVEFDLGVSDAETKGGYAKALTSEQLARQRQLMTKEVAGSDIIILAALVQGRKAPVIMTAEMVRAMAPGSVIVDLAAASGGNCELTKPGETIIEQGVTIDATLDLPDTLPMNGTQMFGRNVATLLEYLWDKTANDGAGGLKLDPADEIVAGCLITKGCRVVQAMTRERMDQEKPGLIARLEAAEAPTQSLSAAEVAGVADAADAAATTEPLADDPDDAEAATDTAPAASSEAAGDDPAPDSAPQPSPPDDSDAERQPGS
jgi:NAD(P) transhydrogenase subunit alpha